MARRAKQDLASFRRDVAALKRAGLIRQSIDARKAFPSTSSNHVRLDELVTRYKSALPSGGETAKIIKVPPKFSKQAKTFKKLGYVTDSGHGKAPEHVMVPAPKGARVEIDSDGNIRVSPPATGVGGTTGVTIIHIPVEYHNMEQYVSDVLANSKKINAMKDANESFGFQFFGSNSHRAFPNIQSLIKYLFGYQSVQEAYKKHHAKDAREMIQNLIIVKGPDKPTMFDFIGQKKRDEIRKGIIRTNRTPATKRKRSKAEVRADWPEWRKEEYRARRRVEEQRRRNRKKKED